MAEAVDSFTSENTDHSDYESACLEYDEDDQIIIREVDGVAISYFVRESESQDIEDYLDNSPLNIKDAINSIYDGRGKLTLKGKHTEVSKNDTTENRQPTLNNNGKDPQVSGAAYNKLKQELRNCKIAIEELKNKEWTSDTPKETIKKIIIGKRYSLEHYRSLPKKLELLDLALGCHDGNVIMAVVLFLKRTLKPHIFATHLNRRPKALSHFIRYLEASKEWKTLLDLYKQLYRNEDALILQYKYISKIENPKTKLREIDKLLSEYRNKQEVSGMTTIIEEERKVLAKQIDIEEEDALAEKQGKNAVLRYYPRTASVLLKPLLTTLYYCAMYHFKTPDSPFHPTSLKKEFKLSGKQYEWSVLPARAKLHCWIDISDILTSTGWLKRKSEKSEIGFDKVTEILHKYGAPKEVLKKNIQLIDNPESRLKAATLCLCHDVAIDTIVTMRDKQKLEQYRENVKFDSQLRQKIQTLLTDVNIKWM